MYITGSSDHYDVLQISRTADPLVIARVFRVLAAQYHPDNKESGDVEIFRRVVEAYEVLSDPVRRAAYDSQLGPEPLNGKRVQPRPLPTLADTNAGDEQQLRRMILHVVYSVRRSRPQNPGVPLGTLAEVCGSTIEGLSFSLWYLRGKKLIETSSDGETVITVAGVDYVEAEGLAASSGMAAPLPLPPGWTDAHAALLEAGGAHSR